MCKVLITATYVRHGLNILSGVVWWNEFSVKSFFCSLEVFVWRRLVVQYLSLSLSYFIELII